jgi:hypoxanthine phosphoribosyltransferase
LISDLVSTGLATAYVARWLLHRGCVGVEHVALLDRRESRLIDLPLTHVAFDAPADLLVGYGLQTRRQFAALPHIALLEPANDRR